VEQIPSCEVDITVLKQNVHKLVLKSLPWVIWIHSTSWHQFSPMRINFPAKFIQPILQYFSNIFLAYHYYNTKHVLVSLSQYKTCSCITVTIQNMYTYHYHNTKHVTYFRHCKY